jgi:hypothetical protein
MKLFELGRASELTRTQTPGTIHDATSSEKHLYRQLVSGVKTGDPICLFRFSSNPLSGSYEKETVNDDPDCSV